jgi:hypothetical protein
MYFFPNANELILYTYAGEKKTSLVTRFCRIIPFKQLTKLVLYYNDISQIIELLRYTTNIHMLTICYESFKNLELEPCDCKTFELVSKTNNIQTLSILSECTLGLIEYFLRLCPRLQHLDIEKPKSKYEFEEILRFLLSKDNDDVGYLSSLRVRAECSTVIYRVIEMFAPTDDFSWYMQRASRISQYHDLYLWW